MVCLVQRRLRYAGARKRSSEQTEFETPQQCVTLFRNASELGFSWTDFIERIHANEYCNAPATLSSLLGEESSWCGPVNCSA